MKKFIIIVVALAALYIGWDYAYYRLGIYIDLHPDATCHLLYEGGWRGNYTNWRTASGRNMRSAA